MTPMTAKSAKQIDLLCDEEHISLIGAEGRIEFDDLPQLIKLYELLENVRKREAPNAIAQSLLMGMKLE